MKLVIFDMDGTLVDTNKIDGECFARALELEFRVDIKKLTWDEDTHVTGPGITSWVFKRVFARYPEAEEFQRLINRFMSLLKESYMFEPQLFSEITGARYLLRLRY